MASKCDNVNSESVSIHSYISPTSSHDASVIFLHGLGDQGITWPHYFTPIRRDHICYIFPSATLKPVTCCKGSALPSWFDIIDLKEDSKDDEKSLEDARLLVESFIDDEIKKGINPERIVLAGLSQGGAIACHTTVNSAVKLGGVILLSTWVPCSSNYSDPHQSVNRSTPVLQCHGNKDNLISFDWGLNTNSIVKRIFQHVDFKSYKELGHWVTKKEFDDIQKFIDKVLPSL